MSCGFTATTRVFISAQQCMKNTLNTNQELFLYRRFNTLKKVLNPASLVKLSQDFNRGSTIRYEQDRSNSIFKNHQIQATPLPCNFSTKVKTIRVGKDKGKGGKVGIYSRFKTMFKEYWYILVPVHLVTSSIWFGSFYYMAASGVDIPAILESLGAPESWIEKFKSSKAGNLFIAYTLYKVVTPLRYTVTVGGTTLSTKYLKKWGWIKPAPDKQQQILQRLENPPRRVFDEKKNAICDLRTSCQEKMQVTKNEFNKRKQEMKKQIEFGKEVLQKTMQETRDGFKEGVRVGAEEIKLYSGVLKREIKDGLGGPKNQKD